MRNGSRILCNAYVINVFAYSRKRINLLIFDLDQILISTVSLFSNVRLCLELISKLFATENQLLCTTHVLIHIAENMHMHFLLKLIIFIDYPNYVKTFIYKYLALY